MVTERGYKRGGKSRCLLLLDKEKLCTVCYVMVRGSKHLEGRFTREKSLIENEKSAYKRI